MATTNMFATVYETLLCSPGMNESVKIDLKINRKTILLLSSVIEEALTKGTEAIQEFIKLVPKEDAEQLRIFIEDCLVKAGLKELSEKMKALNGK